MNYGCESAEMEELLARLDAEAEAIADDADWDFPGRVGLDRAQRRELREMEREDALLDAAL